MDGPWISLVRPLAFMDDMGLSMAASDTPPPPRFFLNEVVAKGAFLLKLRPLLLL